MAANAYDSEARQIRSSLEKQPQYFESLIVDHVEQVAVSRNGQCIAIVHKDPANLNTSTISVSDVNGRKLYSQSFRFRAINALDLSYDNRFLMFVADDTLQVIDIATKRELDRKPLPNFRYARCAETDNRIFWLSGSSITVIYPDFGSDTARSIRMPIRGTVTNALLQNNLLTVTTSEETDHINLDLIKKSSTPLVQSFLLGDKGRVLGIGNKLFSQNPWLTLLDSTGRELWRTKLPGNKYHLTILSGLVSYFVGSSNGKYGLIRFGTNTAPQAGGGSQYFLDIQKGDIMPFLNAGVSNGLYLLSAKCDTAFEFSDGRISAYRLNLTANNCSAVATPVTIGENTRFKLVTLAGFQKDLILTVDGNDQLKLWRFGDARDLERRQQLWTLSERELTKLLSNSTP
jgi:hypothetical protein